MARSSSSADSTWFRGVHFSVFSFMVMALLVLAVVVLAPTVQEYLSQQRQISRQEQAVNALNEQVKQLDNEKVRWSDPSFVAQQARERLFYVLPGQSSYLVIDDVPRTEAASHQKVSVALQKTPTDWVGSLVGSFLATGLTSSPSVSHK